MIVKHPVRRRINIEGIVQGVGFRPFIANLAFRHNLAGFVKNDGAGVIIEVEGIASSLDSFEAEIHLLAPTLSHISSHRSVAINSLNDKQFVIAKSEGSKVKTVAIPPDITLCDDCTSEIMNPDDRRYNHPFATCVNCGPRFSIVRSLPYDRANTTMSEFRLCNDCDKEYRDHTNRRYHAEPIGCNRCGPKLTYRNKFFNRLESEDPINDVANDIKSGKIVAVKGIGGYHLVTDPYNDSAITLLRKRKRRDRKPFALMAKSIETVAKIAILDDISANILTGKSAPIVILKKLDTNSFNEVAKNNIYLGIMLAYAPVYKLLFAKGGFDLIVATSANISDEPLVYKDDEAKERLGEIADSFLTHDRDIFTPVDDSIEKIIAGKPTVLRRSRGYTPIPIKLNKNYPTTLGVGAEIKNSFTIIKDSYGYIGPHIGDLNNVVLYDSFKERIEKFAELVGATKIEVIGHDLHPNYLSTEYAKSFEGQGLSLYGVQHHHAHLASLAGENGISDDMIGIIFDGTGYGLDKTIWGGEFFVGNMGSFKRKGYLKPLLLAGADKAIKEPYRVGLYILKSIFGSDYHEIAKKIYPNINRSDLKVIDSMLEKNINTYRSHGVGRYFDAIGSLIGLGERSHFEGEIALNMEIIVDPEIDKCYQHTISTVEGSFLLDLDDLLASVVSDFLDGVPRSVISSKFHNTLVNGSTEVAKKIREESNLNKVGLSGGVFQNGVISSRLKSALVSAGFEVYVHSRVAPNDGGISLGQALVAATVFSF